ncbi:hypothetical protein E4U60_007801 [Claviceps pazoutovae]|uniref:Uncharacterized protein n=1 Tax=Claviceps pazoutovae TaxID=1649127 RepID=A0A9P7MEC5_9HYPO|nr:hypothetical protein E4U60_007801 [Claviceps pazoutovae]
MLDSAIPSTNKCGMYQRKRSQDTDPVGPGAGKMCGTVQGTRATPNKSSSHQCKQTLDTAYPLPHSLRSSPALEYSALCSSS